MPTRAATQQDYGRRVARAMAHIAAEPDRVPSLQELAEIAAFSPHHFHRIYRAIAGETPAETLLRARMSRAAVELLRGSTPIARIARRAGYGSAAAFTRAFAQAYGLPPGAYRARGGLRPPPRPHPTPLPSPATEPNLAMYPVTIRAEPALRLATIAHRGAYHGIGHAFDRLNAWAATSGLDVTGARWLGLFHDDPNSVPEAALRSDAALVVPAGVTAAGEVRFLDLPPCRVAVLRFEGPYAELEPAYEWLYREWLPNSGEEAADLPGREDYLNDPKSTPPAALLTDIMIPLRDRSA